MAVILASLLPHAAIAAASDDPLPPKTTQTSTECSEGEIFDDDTKTCIPSQDSRFDDDTRYDAVRELAYADAYDRALAVLATMSDPKTSRVQTYYGFLNWKLGHRRASIQAYTNALGLDRDNILARSYLGEAYLDMGNRAAAEEQLAEIRARGGADSWPEYRLLTALSGGVLRDY